MLPALAIGASILFSGCSNTGTYVSANLTNVELSRPNYRIVAANVAGASESGYVLGVSLAMGERAGSLALFRVSGTGMIYQEAVESLWKKFAESHGNPEGKKLALVNVRYDSEALNTLLYTRIRVYVRADVVEFVEDAGKPQG